MDIQGSLLLFTEQDHGQIFLSAALDLRSPQFLGMPQWHMYLQGVANDTTMVVLLP